MFSILSLDHKEKVSFEVKSLFTNNPIEEKIKYINE